MGEHRATFLLFPTNDDSAPYFPAKRIGVAGSNVAKRRFGGLQTWGPRAASRLSPLGQALAPRTVRAGFEDASTTLHTRVVVG